MKNLFSLILLMLATSLCAQDLKEKNTATSKAEAFSEQAGTLIEKQFIDIGSVKGIQIRVLKLKDVISERSVSALRFEYAVKSAYSTDTKIASLDSDEIDGLVKSIRALQSTVFTTTRDVYTEVTFQSRSGFQCGAYYDAGKKGWTPYLQIEKYGKSTVFISQEELAKILSLVEEAKGKM